MRRYGKIRFQVVERMPRIYDLRVQFAAVDGQLRIIVRRLRHFCLRENLARRRERKNCRTKLKYRKQNCKYGSFYPIHTFSPPADLLKRSMCIFSPDCKRKSSKQKNVGKAKKADYFFVLQSNTKK